MKLNKKLEKKIKKTSLNYLENCRDKRFDIPHTLRAVFWMKKILKKEEGDEKILVTATYFHDVGYHGLFNEKIYNYVNVMESKKAHMKKGAEITRKELKKTRAYSKEEIREICNLVGVHDCLKDIKTSNEILVMEADSLSMIDIRILTPSFDTKNWIKFYEGFIKKRVPLFRTKTSKEFLKPLLKEAEKYYIKQKGLIK